MRCMNLRILLLGGAFFATAACATSEEWAEWEAHPSHFASGAHLAFSMKNRFAPPVVATPEDVVLARAQGWWGGPFEPPPLADVRGHWVGTWSGVGAFQSPWTSRAEAEFTQRGRRGEGRLVLADTLTMDVPPVLSIEGLRGVRVVLEVAGSQVVVRHAADGRHLTGVFTVAGDRMVGGLEGSSARLVLTRRR